jgi:uncharacterized membrane protein YdcZ (DUF606 family)
VRPLAFVLAFIVGALVTLQIGSNAKLKEAGFDTRPASIGRIAGCGLMLGGFLLIGKL